MAENTTSSTNFQARIWTSRALIAVVLFLNVQAAVLFLIHPESFAPGFELSGVAGTSFIQGIGLLFLMWNVPYFVALLHPIRHRTSLVEALIMQTIGVIGETTLRCLLPAGHDLIISSVSRFILFDAADLFLLVLAWWITQKVFKSKAH